jgi:hypothetical protein
LGSAADKSATAFAESYLGGRGLVSGRGIY